MRGHTTLKFLALIAFAVAVGVAVLIYSLGRP